MPRYFIDTVERGEVQDRAEADLPNLNAVRAMISRYAGQVLTDTGDEIFERLVEVRVADETGLLLFSITIAAIEAPAVRRR